MGKRVGRRVTRAIKTRSESVLIGDGSGRKLVACGRISPEGSETYVTFESMSPMGQTAARRVFKETSRAEEIANA